MYWKRFSLNSKFSPLPLKFIYREGFQGLRSDIMRSILGVCEQLWRKRNAENTTRNNFQKCDNLCYFEAGRRLRVRSILCVCEQPESEPDAKRAKLATFYFLIAATPGNSLPSIYSSRAPPPVETYDTLSAKPNLLIQATESPPPMSENAP